ncbi:redoxin family protein [Sphingomonas sp.]|uniref:redoxin family protein n=1 Tax=Sphingomonas sp. TaxID=28214 RepID=UPI003AFFE630
MSRPLLWVPLIAFVTVLGVVAWALYTPADRTVRSALVGKPMPAVALPAMVAGKPGVQGGFGGGRRRLVNVFASWCVPCVAEVPQLMRLKALGVPIDGVAIRDTPGAIGDFLARNGDPYSRIGDDRRGQVQLSLGSSGVPETFVVDGDGRILEQHIGDIRAEEVDDLATRVLAR